MLQLDLLVLRKLFFQLGELALQRRLLEVRSLLVGINDFKRNKLIQTLVLVLVYDRLGFREVAL